MEKCHLCYRNRLFPLLENIDISSYEKYFQDNLCDACNMYKQITGIKKRATRYDIDKIHFVIKYSNYIHNYYLYESESQNKDWIEYFEKEISKWIKSNIKSGKERKVFKSCITYFHKDRGVLIDKKENCINLTHKKFITDWLLENYHKLKNL